MDAEELMMSAIVTLSVLFFQNLFEFGQVFLSGLVIEGIYI